MEICRVESMHGDKGMGIDRKWGRRVRWDDGQRRRVEVSRKKWEYGVGLSMARRKLSLFMVKKPENFRKKGDVWIEWKGKGTLCAMKHPIYLDNAATTALSPEALEAM